MQVLFSSLILQREEVPELKLDDGATRIFLNTHGKHPEFVSPELIELLKYMEHSTERTDNKTYRKSGQSIKWWRAGESQIV